MNTRQRRKAGGRRVQTPDKERPLPILAVAEVSSSNLTPCESDKSYDRKLGRKKVFINTHEANDSSSALMNLSNVEETPAEENEVLVVDNATHKRERDVSSELYKSEVERFIEVSKYFSSPLRKTASYICEYRLVTFPNPFRIEYKRGGVAAHHMKFSNLTLEPVFIKLYKVIPDLEQIKFINLSLSRCKRIPPGLSFTLGFVYDDVNEKPSCNAKMIFVASRKTTTPCYQICEITLQIEPLKIRIV